MITTLELSDGTTVAMRLRRSSRATRLTLRVSSRDGRVSLTVPTSLTELEALSFARSKRNWVQNQLSQITHRQALRIGDTIPVYGEARRIVLADSRAPALARQELRLPQNSVCTPGPIISGFLKAVARDPLFLASERFASQLGRQVTRITLRDPRTRWGSCSFSGAIMYSWRLVMAPPEVLDYVAAHEVAHLVEMNHAPAFWAVVAYLMPEYECYRRWLKEHGPSLQRIVLD